MPLSNSISNYSDVEAVLTQVAQSGKIAEFELSTAGAARNWMQRANKFKPLAIKRAEKLNPIKEIAARTPFDSMFFVVRHNIVVIHPTRPQAGKLRIEGEEVEAPVPLPNISTSADRPTTSQPGPSGLDALDAALNLVALKESKS